MGCRAVFFVFTLLNLLCAGALQQIQAQRVKASFSGAARLFVQNNGQLRDQHNQPNPSVRYLYLDDRFRMHFRSDGFSYELLSIERPFLGRDEAVMQPQSADEPEPFIVRSHRVDVVFAGMNASCRLRALRPAETVFHYYLAPVSNHRYEFVPAYGMLVYEQVYPGIDLVFSAPDERNRMPRYEFVVRPGADPSLIAWNYSGATSLEVRTDGAFRISTPLGEITESAPRFFADFARPLPGGAFAFQGSQRTFSCPDYDKDGMLLIDPNIVWGTYYGGAGGDEPVEIYATKNQQVFVCGHTVSLQFIATSGAHQTTFAGGVYDYYLAKFNQSGKVSWATYFGGNDKDYCFAGALDPLENFFIAGNTESNGMATAGAHKTTISGTAADNLIAKFQSNGTLLWSTYYGGAGSENIRSMISDAAGYLYIAGTTYSDTGIATPGAFQTVKHNYDDGFLAKFTPGGQLVWGTYVGDSGVDRFHAITMDLFGHIYAAGTTSSKKGIATPGVHQTVYGGSTADAFLCKFDTGGHRLWCTYYGGQGEDRTRGLETDSAGTVFLAGFTNSDSAIATPGSLQPYRSVQAPGSTNEDNYLVRFDSSGMRLWGTFYGGVAMENLWGADIDRKNKFFYVVGSTNSPTNIAYGNAMQPVKNTAADGFLAKFRFDGFPEWATYWGGPVGQQFEDVDVDTSGFIYALGRPTAGDMLVTPGTHQSVFQGGYSETIVYKFSPFETCYDAFEPNESLFAAAPAPAYPIGSTTIYGVNGCIPDSLDQDWFLVKPSATYPHLRFIVRDATVNYDLALYDAFGYLIHQTGNSGSVPDTLTINNLPVLDFYLQIIHNDTLFDAMNCYRLQIMYSDTALPGGIVYTSTHSLQNLGWLYPNPARDWVQVPADQFPAEGNWGLFSLSGRLMDAGTIDGHLQGSSLRIPIAHLPSGLYVVQVLGPSQMQFYKFMKD
ncbi:MAG: T9SS type A sorting domain-containing protein [Chitinophagales bacterium]|nr:T9SS type A sorting domain-containing protein [Chitinophagales bacterium]MDW8393185.1 T9SS type A sorting domain-containing protein [Chitinophagales bacterium]